MLIVLSLLAALGYGVSDFAGGVAARRLRPLTALLYGEPVGVLLILMLLPLFPGQLSLHAVLFAIASGMAGLVGLGLMYRLMASQPLNVVSPVTAVLAAATPLLCGIVSGEHPNPSAWLGIVVGLLAVALISGERNGGLLRARVSARVVLMALGAGAGFGVYFVLIAHAGHGSGVLVLIVARLTSVLVLVPVATQQRAVAFPRGATGVAALAAGLCDAAADVCFLLASREGYLSFAGVITALYPAVTVLLAVLVLRERAGWLPCTGLGLSVVSLALIAH